MGFSSKIFKAAYIIIFLLAIAGFTLAQRQLEVSYPEIGGIKPTVTTISLPEYLKYIFNFSIVLAGLIAFGVLVYAGFQYLTSAGNPAAVKDSQERIGGALVGLLVILSSYLILTTVNPQLTFFDLPGLKGIVDFQPGNKPADDKTLRALEIPLGKLIKEALNTDILDKIDDLLPDIKTASQEVQKTAEELKALTDACTCSGTLPNASSCDYGQNCPATACLGEPCADRAAIGEKAKELLPKTEALKALLENKKEKDKKSGLKELADNLIKNFQNLQEAETAVKSCSGQGGTLMTATDFDNYQKSLKSAKEIEKVEIDKKFWPKLTANDYFLVFYCVEEPLKTTIPEEKVAEIPGEFPEGEIKESKVFCGAEIPLGETTDAAQDLMDQIIQEIQAIIGSSEKIIAASQSLPDLSGQCKGVEACSTGCNQYLIPRPDKCLQLNVCPEEEEPGYDPECDPQKCLKGEPVPAEEVCDIVACTGSVCPNAEISRQLAAIKESSLTIESSLGVGTKENKAQIAEINSQLAISSKGTDNCFNSAEKIQRALEGNKELIKELNPCRFIKELAESEIYFYNEQSGKEIKDCYGQEPGQEEKMDNYFCCQTEVNSQ